MTSSNSAYIERPTFDSCLCVQVSIGCLVFSGSFIIELIVAHGVALCGVADAYAADVSEIFCSGIINSLTLMEARVDAAHSFTSDHADFVEKYELSVSEVFLKRSENVIVLNFVEHTQVEPFD